MSRLRLVYFGSPAFAVPSLRALASDPRFDIVRVVSQPDRPAGRGRRLTPSAVAAAADELSLATWKPETLRTPEAIARLKADTADLFVVVAYGEIFRRSVLEAARCGCLNVHPSLLPRYRGSGPVQAPILNGDDETGVSIIQMVRRLDAGPIVAQRRIRLNGDETGDSLGAELAEVAAEMLPDTAAEWSDGKIEPVPQDEAQATYTREFTKQDGQIDWRRSARAIERQIRGLYRWPGSWTRLAGKRLGVLASELTRERESMSPGRLEISGRDVLVSCGSGVLRLLQVQPEGKAGMDALAWARGARLTSDAAFELPLVKGTAHETSAE